MDEVDRGGRALREAIQQYLEAIQSEPGHSWLSAAAHALEESTRKGYAAALRRLRKHSREQFGASPRQVLELEIKEMVETSVSTAKKGGQASGMWRSGHGQSGGYCSFGKSDESNTGVPTCPFPSRTRRDYRQDGKRLLEARTSKGTGGMHCVGVGRRSHGAPASRRSCSQEGGSLPVSPRITATRRTCGPAKDGCTSRFRWTGGGGDGRSVPVQVRRTTCGQYVAKMGPSGSARRCTSAMPWGSGECGRHKETEKKQIPGAHVCRAHRVRQRVQQRRRIPVHGV